MKRSKGKNEAKGSPSYYITSRLVENLFTAETRRLDKIIEGLLKDNIAITGKAAIGFVYQGDVYCPDKLRNLWLGHLSSGEVLPALHLDLCPRMRDYMEDSKAVLWDKSQIRQTLYQLIFPSRTFAEIRDALPDCLAEFLEETRELPRVLSQEHLLNKMTPRQREQYNKILEKIQMYCATRLLY